ncbi:MNN2 [[Candida] subhashii]|uniref:MNN2 n=1 Tax=[Candida] subhashii TaxID=561895 RepID=A0A8J5QXB6_9ASCO|nr:MNN2 [[Candida] subhashii]KAG7666165.1 MNN2 [[Candida] subhashii]
MLPPFNNSSRKISGRKILSFRAIKVPLVIAIFMLFLFEVSYLLDYTSTSPINSVHQYVSSNDASTHSTHSGSIDDYSAEEYEDDKEEGQVAAVVVPSNTVSAPTNTKLPGTTTPPPPKKTTPKDFWESIFNIFSIYKFEKDDFPLIKLTSKENQYNPKEKTRKTFLSKSIIKDIEMLKQHHRNIFNSLPDKIPDSVYEPESKGIVTIGGGFFSWMAYIQILQLRKIGCELPVELIIPKIEDFNREQDFCENLLPKYNAKCIVVQDRFGVDVVKEWDFASYQFKAVALAMSSFQHTLLLDSDNVPVQAPDRLFESKVYKANGMVLWPDYWQRTMSPEWHDIIGKPYSLTEKVRDGRFPLVIPQELTPEEEENTKFNDLKGTLADLSTESGQVMINKGTHGKVVLMTLYYNLFGPALYYKLFSLGALGEGDKDTFAAAAHVCDKEYYQVKSYIHTYGYFDNGYHGMTMAQKDPEEDYQTYLRIEKEYREKGKNWDKAAKDQFSGDNKVPVFTLHCNMKKIDPASYIKDESISDLEANRMKVRFYSNFKIKLPGSDGKEKVLDFERTRWETIEEIACQQKVKFSIFKDQNMDKICTYIRNTIEWLKETEKK